MRERFRRSCVERFPVQRHARPIQALPVHVDSGPRLRHRPVPGHPCVTVGLGAAHGFKFAALFGRLLTDMAIDGESRYDLSAFRFNRPALDRPLLRR